MKYLVLSLLMVLGMGAVNVERGAYSVERNKTYTTRVTAAGFGSKVNCEGKSLRKLAKRYGNICAVEQGTIPLYSKVYIPETNQTYTVVDYIPKSSTMKHKRRASKRGIDLDLCIDRYKDVSKRQLYKYDLDITEVRVVR